VEKGGGVPLLLPLSRDERIIEKYVDIIDGLLLSGGGDVDPALYEEEPHWELEGVSPERDRFEIALIRKMLARKGVILGICRGIQVLNTALGGTLYQDLRTQCGDTFQHRQDTPRKHPAHTVKIQEGSRLYSVIGNTVIRVNSLHHQAVKGVADGLKAVCWAGDGVIEGVEAPELPFVIGVQWHPEAMWQEHEHASSLFRAFVRAAAQQKIKHRSRSPAGPGLNNR